MNTNEEFRTAVLEIWDKIKEAFQKFDQWLSGVFSTDWSKQFGILGSAANGFFTSISGVWDNVKKIFDGIITFVKGVFSGDWKSAWDGIKQTFSGVFGALEGIAKAPLNGVIGLLNGAINAVNKLIRGFNKIGFDMPDFLGGGSWHPSIPTIPNIAYLAKGGTLLEGSAVVGEVAPELLTVSNGRVRVQPLGSGEQPRSVEGGGFHQTININSPSPVSPAEAARHTRNATRALLRGARL